MAMERRIRKIDFPPLSWQRRRSVHLLCFRRKTSPNLTLPAGHMLAMWYFYCYLETIRHIGVILSIKIFHGWWQKYNKHTGRYLIFKEFKELYFSTLVASFRKFWYISKTRRSKNNELVEKRGQICYFYNLSFYNLLVFVCLGYIR